MEGLLERQRGLTSRIWHALPDQVSHLQPLSPKRETRLAQNFIVNERF